MITTKNINIPTTTNQLQDRLFGRPSIVGLLIVKCSDRYLKVRTYSKLCPPETPCNKEVTNVDFCTTLMYGVFQNLIVLQKCAMRINNCCDIHV